MVSVYLASRCNYCQHGGVEITDHTLAWRAVNLLPYLDSSGKSVWYWPSATLTRLWWDRANNYFEMGVCELVAIRGNRYYFVYILDYSGFFHAYKTPPSNNAESDILRDLHVPCLPMV